ncbi:transcriptional regulator FilR1 domain-containing protein [Halobacterium bonnevillei]
MMYFMTLLRNSETLRVSDTSRVNLIFVDEIHDQIRSGMASDAIYPPAVVEDITSTYPDATESLLESGQLTLSTHDAFPFGLAIFDDRIGLGGYDPDSGLLSAFVDTDDPDARAWALALFDPYRASAAPVPTPRG